LAWSAARRRVRARRRPAWALAGLEQGHPASQDPLGPDDAKRLMLWPAHPDTLTRLPNRNLFEERLNRAVLDSRESGARGAVLSIDLDRFKMVNDSVGPAKADQVLVEAACRLAMCVDEQNTVARLGGDHFGVLMT